MPYQKVGLHFSGDSITSPASFSFNFPNKLRRLLLPYRIEFENTAIGGTNFTNLLINENISPTGAKLDNYPSSNTSNILILGCGTNDMTSSDETVTYGRLRTFLQSIAASNRFNTYFIGLTIPYVDNTAANTPRRFAYNTLVKNGLATDLKSDVGVNANIYVIDYTTLAPFSTGTSPSDTTYYQVDGIHPTSAGFDVMAAYVKQRLNEQGFFV